MGMKAICDGCGKEAPAVSSGGNWFKPSSWYERTPLSGGQQERTITACSRGCIDRLQSLGMFGPGEAIQTISKFKMGEEGRAVVKKVSVGGKKWYVGSRGLLEPDNGWRHNTLDAAIAHAKQLCEETDEPQIVVQIVRLVRPQKTPIVVEKV